MPPLATSPHVAHLRPWQTAFIIFGAVAGGIFFQEFALMVEHPIVVEAGMPAPMIYVLCA